MANSSLAERPASRTSSTLMDPSLYKAAMEGMIDVLVQNKGQLEVLVSPNNNTVLHIAAQFGKLQCVRDILYMCPVIYDRLNSKDETPLHVAAREGHFDIVRVLIEHAKDEERGHGVEGAAKEMLMLANNKEKDTALHEAVRNCHAELVQLLMKEAPELSHMANEAEETPLYLAAERGSHELVSLILTNCPSAAYGGPYGRTALHAAILHDNRALLHAAFLKNTPGFLSTLLGFYWKYDSREVLSESAFHNFKECTKVLLDWKQALLKKADIHGWMPLHYAARCGFVSPIRQLLDKDKSVAYLTADKNDEMAGLTALHIAATQGHVDVMKVLISECPGCWEMVNSRGENILHTAVQNEKKKAIKFILSNSSLNSLINQKDDDGNTPLHLLAASTCYLPELITHPVADKSSFNKKNLTPLDIASYSNKYFTSEDLVEVFLKGGGASMGWRNIISMDKDKIAAKEEARARKRQRVVPEDMRKATDTHLIVAALIATVTFAAGFTVPGGFDGNEGPNQGLAILSRKAAFQAFVISDTTAMILSTCAVFVYLCAATFVDKRQLLIKFILALVLNGCAMVAAVIAFMTGMYAVLSHSQWLAITQCLIGGLFFTYTAFVLLYQKRSWAKKSLYLDVILDM